MNINEYCYPLVCGRIGRGRSMLGYSMHTAAFNHLKLPFVYVTFDTEDTAEAIKILKNFSFRGYSVTIPHKELAMSLMDVVSPEAKAIGALNTIIQEDGKLTGYNTDWIGIRDALNEAGVSVQGKKVIILGAGGASRAAIYTFKFLGASSILLANRSAERANLLAKEFDVNYTTYDKLSAQTLAEAEILFNAAPFGSEEKIYPFAVDKLNQNTIIFDTVAQETPLITISEKRGLKTIRGIRMLLHQALAQFEYFTATKAPKEIMDEALRLNYH
jgi:shikimate dehydrogenase